MPPEVKEVLKQDPEGNKLFHKLTPGKQRSMLYWLSRTKDIDRRIHETLIFVEHLKKNGAPVDWFIVPPAVARFQGMGLARRAPHPHAAVLFFDFMLTDAQELLARMDFTVTSRKTASAAQKLPLKFIDPKLVLDESEKWGKLYEDIVVKQGK